MRITLMFIFSFSSLASEFCSNDIVIFGETASYNRVNGQIKLEKKNYLLPYDLSEHMGTFHNIIIRSPYMLNSIELGGDVFSLSRNDKIYQTFEFNLDYYLRKNDVKGKVTITLKGPSGFSCIREHEVIEGE